MNRRTFIKTTGAAVALTTTSNATLSAATQPAGGVRYSAFTKPFRNLGFEETAEFVVQVGWDGVELPVRSSSSHIEPARVEADLPKMQAALHQRGKQIFIVTTDVMGVDPVGEKVLRTAAQLGIKHYRLGTFHYDLKKPIAPQVADIKSKLKDLAALNRELGIQGALQNHSSAKYVGAPIWDIHEIIRDLDPAEMGICFDIGHATLEGGYAWDLNWRLMRDRFAAVYVKDFVWEKQGDEWEAKWCPLGEGMVNPRFFKDLLASGYNGILNQHHEYDHGQGKVLLENCRRDLGVLKNWVGAK
jgi:sugar phosphate isomerase/epimerase